MPSSDEEVEQLIASSSQGEEEAVAASSQDDDALTGQVSIRQLLFNCFSTTIVNIRPPLFNGSPSFSLARAETDFHSRGN